MKFEFYRSDLDKVPKLSVDGTVPNSIHFSHWEGNETPVEVKADTSTEIVLNVVASSEMKRLTQGIELVTNNHFDTDGVLSVWSMLAGEQALALRDKLIAAAEAGDFCEFRSDDGVRASIVIQGADQAGTENDAGSPLASYLAGESVTDEAREYELVLPEVEKVLTKTNDYEHLWRAAWIQIARARESFERGESSIEEFDEPSLSLITLAPNIFGAGGLNPARHSAPFTVISKYSRGRLFLIATPLESRWTYRIDYPYYSWAETVVRPRIERHDFTSLISELDRLESNKEGHWQIDRNEMTSAVKFLGPDERLAGSTLTPERVAETVRRELSYLERAAAVV
ncbi:MAG TPA: DUF6687 family protein [Pyrinomonadaceae bacterium]|nr:DUF6687 family protein [Pyrinomonadaceae bacterium]